MTITRRRDNDVDFGISAQSDSKKADFSPEALGAKGPKHNTYNPKPVEPMAKEWLIEVLLPPKLLKSIKLL